MTTAPISTARGGSVAQNALKGPLVLLLASPEPVGALLCVPGRGREHVTKAWSANEGPMPDWVRGASLTHRTLMVRTDLHALLEPLPAGGDQVEARARLARLDLPEPLVIAAGGGAEDGFALALRTSALHDAFDQADRLGVAVDGVTTDTGVLAASLAGRGALGWVLEGTAILTARGADSLDSRRIRLDEAEGANRLGRAIRLLAGQAGCSRLSVMGEAHAAVATAQQAAGSIEVTADPEPTPSLAHAALLRLALDAAASGRLPVLMSPRQSRTVAAIRWSLPGATATVLLAVAAGGLLWHAGRAYNAVLAERATEQRLAAELAVRQETLQPLLNERARLAAATRPVLHARDESGRLASALASLDAAVRGSRSLVVTQVRIEPEAGTFLVAGDVQADAAAGELQHLVDELSGNGFQAGHFTFSPNQGARTPFTLQMEVAQ